MAFQIDFFDNIYIRNFYDEIIPKMNTYFRLHQDKELVFNFSDLYFMSPNVIPNILNIADIYKKYFNNTKKIRLNLSWNPDFLSYLSTINFFKYSHILDLFDFNEEMLGGFETYSIEKNCRLIFSEKDSTEDEIKHKVESLMHTMIKFQELEKDEIVINNVNEILGETLFHLIHNANEKDRGNSNAYGIFQINNYSGKKYVYISISDGGISISPTIWNKLEKDEAYQFFVTKEQDPTYRYILEALFWRKRMNIILQKNIEKQGYLPKGYKHGIYHVANYVLKNKGRIGIHSNDTYFLFTEKFYETFCHITNNINQERDKNPESDMKNISNHIDMDLQASIDNYTIQNTKTRKYRGVHIDIEIPLGEKE